MERFLNKHQALIQIVGGILATGITITVFSFQTFQTKESAKESAIQLNEKQDYIYEYLEKRLDRIENKIDQITK